MRRTRKIIMQPKAKDFPLSTLTKTNKNLLMLIVCITIKEILIIDYNDTTTKDDLIMEEAIMSKETMKEDMMVEEAEDAYEIYAVSMIFRRLI